MLDRELDLIPGASGLPSRSRNQSADAEHQNVAGKTSGAQLRRLLRLREQAQTQLAKREVICAPRRRRLAHDSLRGVERLPIAALVVMTEREMGLGHHVVRIDLESASEMTRSLFEHRDVREHDRETLVRVPETGTAGERGGELRERSGDVESAERAPEQYRAGVPGFGQARLEGERLLAHCLSPIPPVPLRVEAETHPRKGGRKTRPGERETRVGLRGLLERFDRRVDVVDRLPGKMEPSLHVELVSIPRGARRPGETALFRRGQLDLKGLGDLPGHAVLHLEDVVERGVDLRSPERAAIRSPHELDCHPEA